MRSKVLSPFFLLIMVLTACQPETSSEVKNEIAPNNNPSDTTKPSNNQETHQFEDLVETYDPPDREFWQKPELVIQKMGNLVGKTIADIGAGTGFFTFRLAQKADKVIAIEIDKQFVTYMDSLKRVSLPSEFQDNMEIRLATKQDSKLEKEEADIILIVNTFIYLGDGERQKRLEYLKHLKDILPDNGKLFIIDFKKKRIPIQKPGAAIRMPLFEVEKELIAAGFDFVSDDLSLDYQYIIIARKDNSQ